MGETRTREIDGASRTRRRATRLAWVLWAIGLGLAIASVFFLAISIDAPAPEGQFGFRGFAALFAIAFGTVGALIASRVPSNPIGWVFLTVGLVSGFQELANQYAIHAVLGDGGGLPLGEAAAWVPAWIWVPATSGAMYLLLLFPDGRTLSPPWRWVLVVGTCGAIVGALGFALAPGPLENFHPVENPLAMGSEPAIGAMTLGGMAVYGLAIVSAAASLVVRFRRSRGEERQRLKWLVASGLFLSLALVSSFIGWIGAPGSTPQVTPLVAVVILGFLSLPVATGIAILRHRLFDIDVVISRTMAYATLPAFITIVYVTIAIGVGTVVGARGSPFLSAVAAAVAALAFQPARRRAQHVANRLVYGERATPYEVLSELSARFAGTYSLEDALPRLARVTAQAIGAERSSVWLRRDGELRPAATWPGESLGASMPVPGDGLPSFDELESGFAVRHQGELLGALTVRMPASEPLGPAQEKLLSDVAAQAGLMLRNVALLEDLRASRRRLVTAQDDRARKLERNIHDGAQQQLVGLVVQLRLLEQQIERDPAGAKAAVARLQGVAATALEDLRDLARGIYPPLLADEGLPVAPDAQARKAPIPVSVSADGVGRFPREVESAVYFSVLEALTNAAKYAEATGISIELEHMNGMLTFAVADDGHGFDPAASGFGTGLQGMADRLEAIGGALMVRSAPGSGTSVIGRIPVEDPT